MLTMETENALSSPSLIKNSRDSEFLTTPSALALSEAKGGAQGLRDITEGWSGLKTLLIPEPGHNDKATVSFSHTFFNHYKITQIDKQYFLEDLQLNKRVEITEEGLAQWLSLLQ